MNLFLHKECIEIEEYRLYKKKKNCLKVKMKFMLKNTLVINYYFLNPFVH